MNGTGRRGRLASWTIAAALSVAAATGWSVWLHAGSPDSGLPCQAGPDSPGLAAAVALIVVPALLTGLASAGLRQRKRTIAAQAVVTLMLSAVLIIGVAFDFVGVHHCFD